MEGMEGNSVQKENKWTAPVFKNWNVEFWVAVLGLVIVLLPAILVKLFAFNPNMELTSESLIAQPSFNAATMLVGLVFSIYAMAKAKDNHATKTIALLALIVTIVRLLLQ